MNGTDIVTVGRALPKLASVEPGNGRHDVRVTWAAGERAGRTDTINLAPMIFTFKVFKPLRDDAVAFDAVRLGEYGASIVWPGNDDLDIGADAIEEMAAEIMTGADFSAFLKRNALTFDAAAAQLGIARRLVAYYAKGREIPRYIALACRQIDTMLGAGVKEARTPDQRPPALVYGQVEGDKVIMVQEQAGGDAFGLVSAAEAMEKLLSGEWHLLPADREDLRRRMSGQGGEGVSFDRCRLMPVSTDPEQQPEAMRGDALVRSR